MFTGSKEMRKEQLRELIKNWKSKLIKLSKRKKSRDLESKRCSLCQSRNRNKF